MNKHFKRVLMVLLSGGIIAGSTYGLKVISDTTGGIDYKFWTMFDSLFGKEDDKTNTDKPGKVTVKSIELDTTAVKTEYGYGEEFSTEGLKITATMSDGTTKEASLEDCAIAKPDMKKPGKQEVTVRYGGVSATYEITVAERQLPPISSTSLADINKNGKYRIEAESIDLEVSGVEATNGALRQEDGNASGGRYVGNYGVKGNYFGFTFTADKEYQDVLLVLKLANPTEKSLNYDNVKIYLNYKSATQTGEIDLKALPALAAKSGDSLTWETKRLEGLTIPAGTNTLTFDIVGENVPCIDSIELYVGTAFQTSNKTDLNVESGTTVYKEFEDMDLSKIQVRPDIKEHWGLGDGEAFIETPTSNLEGTSGGKSVGAFNPPTEISTMMCLNEKATVEILFSTAGATSAYIADVFEFTLDGEPLTDIQRIDIKGNNNPGQSKYWEWVDTSLGWFDLEAGEYEFIAKMVKTASMNADCFKFVVHSYGEFTDHIVPDPEPDTPDPKPTDKGIVTINEVGNYVQEAEELPNDGVVTRADFVGAGRCEEGEYLIETPASASGGKSISGFAVGTKFTVKLVLEKAAKLDVILRALCADNENYDIGDHLKFMLDDEQITASGNIYGLGWTDGWSGWHDAKIAEGLSLTAGEHTLTMELIGAAGTYLDFDCFKFNVTEYDGQTTTNPDPDPDPEPDTPQPDTPKTYEINITDNGDYVKEAEEFSKEYAVTRSDFETAYGDIGYVVDGGRIFGFGAGSKYPITVYAEKQCVIDVSMTMFGGGGALNGYFALKLDDQTLSVADGNMPGGSTMAAVTLAKNVAVTAGEHTLWIEIKTHNFDIDKVTVTAKNYDEEFGASDPTPSYDLTVSENGTYTVEAETLDTSGIVLQSGIPTYTEVDSKNASNSCLRGVSGGSKITVHFYLEKDATVELAAYMAKFESDYDLRGKAQFTVDGGEAISVTADEGFGRAPDGSNDWHNWKKVTIGSFNLTAGEHTLVLEVLDTVPAVDGIANTDRFTFEVSNMAE